MIQQNPGAFMNLLLGGDPNMVAGLGGAGAGGSHQRDHPG